MTDKIKKLPKQWKQWCRRAGLKPHGGGNRSAWRWFYLEGRGRYWRVNCHGMLDVSCPRVDFDRWALSHRASLPCPVTCERDFLATVQQLLDQVRSLPESAE